MTSDHNPYAPPGAIVGDEELELSTDEVRAFTGENADYYLRKWAPMLQDGRKLSFNGAALFLQYYWLGYRRMYRELVVFSLVPLLLILGPLPLMLGSGDDAEGRLPIFLAWIIATVVTVMFVYGWLTNWLYLQKALRTVRAARTTAHDPMTRLNEIARRGQTSWWAVIVLVVLNAIGTLLDNAG